MPSAQLSRVPRAVKEARFGAVEARACPRGDTVAVMLANTPAMLERHYGAPMCGAVLNALNIRQHEGFVLCARPATGSMP
jgi:acyl-CoA synthetase (AMP-forming)/AMP-acid ligase II